MTNPTDGHSQKIKAYAILAGGGVKGAALVGGLHAAEARGIQFEGYGGASAGSLVALLASIGYRDRELRNIIDQTDFLNLFDDETGGDLGRLKRMRIWRSLLPWNFLGDIILLNRIRVNLGLYEGHHFKEFLLPKIINKCPKLDNIKNINFQHLIEERAKVLKIIVSDISHRKALVYCGNPGKNETEGVVLDAVRASIGYPFVFKPHVLHEPEAEKRYLVDGGLSSNLPVFLFAGEHKSTGYPVLAFDLILPEEKKPASKKYRFTDFCGDLIGTALEVNDELQPDLYGTD